MNEKKNLHITGKQNILGGNYKEVRISGCGTIQGPLTAEELRVSDLARFRYSVSASQLKVNGKVTIDDQLNIGEAKVSGLLTVKREIQCMGDFVVTGQVKSYRHVKTQGLKVSGMITSLEGIEAKTLNVSGKLKANQLKVDDAVVSGMVVIAEAISAKELEINGMVKVQAIESEVLTVKGRLVCGGSINAEKVEIEAKSGSSFEEIGATEVKIQPIGTQHGMMSLLTGLGRLFEGPTLVKGNLIEADSIYVENARIKKICGHDIVIGPNCNIDEIEYSGTLTIDETSTVKRQTKR